MTMNNDIDRIKRRAARLDQQFKILVSKKDFQEDVAAFRKKWNIDPGKLKTTDDTQDWWHSHYENADKWRGEEWPKYKVELIALEKAALDLNNKEVKLQEVYGA